MRKIKSKCGALVGVVGVSAMALWPLLAFAQHDHLPPPGVEANAFLNGTEVLTGLAAAIMAFQAALAYREGRLGKGMTWVAVGMVIMAVGHFILVVRRMVGDPLGFLGPTGSFVAFSLAVLSSFVASGLGFWLIRRASRGN